MKIPRIKEGTTIWLPCQVRSGPFPDERRVYVSIGPSEWFGFVNVSELRQGLPEGDDHVKAMVTGGKGDQVTLGIRGAAPASNAIRAQRSSLISEYGAQQA
ncbi:MAG: hypothetical protein ACREQI_15490 [Candidatus Binataceae bacterium]